MADEKSKCPRTPIEAHEIKKGHYVILSGRPCKVDKAVFTKTGKHGHMKGNIIGIDVLTGKKYNDVIPGHHPMTEFKIFKADYQVIGIDGNEISGLDESGIQQKVTLNTDTEMYKKLDADFDEEKTLVITIVRAPVEISKDNFKEEEIVESYKESKP